MKKLLIIAAFVATAFAVQAQNANPSKDKKETSTIQSPAVTKETNVTNVTPAQKDVDKKECGDKKNCGDMKKGKSCCAPKAKS